MTKYDYRKLLLVALCSSILACGGFRAYDEPREEPRSWVQVSNYSEYQLEVFAYDANGCDEQRDIGRFGSVSSGYQNKPGSPRAVASGQRTTFCIDVYDFDEDVFICRRAVAIDAKEGQDYRIEFRMAGEQCATPEVKTLSKGYIRSN